jgi:hypothetical protein
MIQTSSVRSCRRNASMIRSRVMPSGSDSISIRSSADSRHRRVYTHPIGRSGRRGAFPGQLEANRQSVAPNVTARSRVSSAGLA